MDSEDADDLRGRDDHHLIQSICACRTTADAMIETELKERAVLRYPHTDPYFMRLQIAGLDSLAVIVCRTLGRLREQGFDFIIESVVEIRRDIVIRELFFDC